MAPLEGSILTQFWMLLGYAEAQLAWERDKSLNSLTHLFHDTECILEHFISTWDSGCIGLAADVGDGVKIDELQNLGRAMGCLGALKDILTDTSDERDKLQKDIEEKVSHIVAKDRLMTYIQQDYELLKQGPAPYETQLAQEYPGLPQEAIKYLAMAKFLRANYLDLVPPEEAAINLGKAIEFILRQGLLRKMDDYASSLGPGYYVLRERRGGNQEIWIGHGNEQESSATRLTLGAASLILRPPHTEFVEDFIESQGYPEELRRWIVHEASKVLDHIARLRNPAAHGGEGVYLHKSLEMMHMVFEGGLLKRLLEAGGLSQSGPQ